MKKLSILPFLSLFLLASCGPTTNPTTDNSTTSVTNPTISESEPSVSTTTPFVESENENIVFKMYGDLYLNGMRTIYVTLSNEYSDQEIVWESSNETIVSVTGREGLSTEGLVTAHSYGEAYIKASLKDYPEISTTKKFVISKGETMPAELFNSIKGGATLKSKDEFIIVNKNFEETIEQTEYLDVIYEENDPSNSYTDAYQMTIKNKNNEVTKEYKYVRDENKKQYVAKEYLDFRNNVRAQAIEQDGEKLYWDFSTYFNPLADENNVTNLDFESFDGGKTYHFVSYYTGMSNLALSLYLSNFSPDDMWFEVENGSISLNAYVEPYNSQTTSAYKYARKVTTEFSNLGSSVIDHIQPYEKYNYHNDIESALSKIKNNNYTVNYSISFNGNTTISYQYTYTENAIDEIIYNNGVQTYHAGYYKVNEEKFVTYEFNDDAKELTFIKTHNKNWESSSLYPTFDFAVEVFKKVDDNLFETYENHGALLSRCITLNDAYIFALQESGKATLSLSDEGNLSTINADFLMEEEEVSINTSFSNIGNSVIDIDFDTAVESKDPTTWEEANISLYNELVLWGIEDVVPFLFVKQNYEGYTGINGHSYAVNFVYFNTNLFDNETDRDAFIEAYRQLLIEEGFVEDGINDYTGYKVYTKGSYSIGVGAEKRISGISATKEDTLRAQITISSPLITEAYYN